MECIDGKPVYVQVYMECIDDNPVYVQGGGGCVYGVYR